MIVCQRQLVKVKRLVWVKRFVWVRNLVRVKVGPKSYLIISFQSLVARHGPDTSSWSIPLLEEHLKVWYNIGVSYSIWWLGTVCLKIYRYFKASSRFHRLSRVQRLLQDHNTKYNVRFRLVTFESVFIPCSRRTPQADSGTVSWDPAPCCSCT